MLAIVSKWKIRKNILKKFAENQFVEKKIRELCLGTFSSKSDQKNVSPIWVNNYFAYVSDDSMKIRNTNILSKKNM